MIITNVVRHLTKTPFTTNICLCTGLVGQTLRGEGVQVRGVKISMRWQMMRRQFMVWDSRDASLRVHQLNGILRLRESQSESRESRILRTMNCTTAYTTTQVIRAGSTWLDLVGTTAIENQEQEINGSSDQIDLWSIQKTGWFLF